MSGFITLVLTGACIGISLPFGSWYIVPTLMSYFGTIVPGVGTIHSATGIVALFQSFSCISAFFSGTIGALCGVATWIGKFMIK